MKSREEILTPLRGTGKYYHCVDYEDALKAMEEYTSQQALASTPPVSAMEDGWVKVEIDPNEPRVY